MFNTGNFSRDCAEIRRQSPLILNITNYVAMNFSANALLAVGASPLMSKEREEAEELANSARALVINIGCLETADVAAMERAAAVAHGSGKPWVLDPVGAGLSRLRSETALRLIREYSPSLVRGNASEIMFLAGLGRHGNGVDSLQASEEALPSAVSLARSTGAVVAVSGATDYLTDGERVTSIGNGSAMMSAVTAMGCTASAICAAFLSVNDRHLEAATNAMALTGLAGEIAAGICKGPGTMSAAFLDALYGIDAAKASESIIYEEVSA